MFLWQCGGSRRLQKPSINAGPNAARSAARRRRRRAAPPTAEGGAKRRPPVPRRLRRRLTEVRRQKKHGTAKHDATKHDADRVRSVPCTGLSLEVLGAGFLSFSALETGSKIECFSRSPRGSWMAPENKATGGSVVKTLLLARCNNLSTTSRVITLAKD